MSIFGVVCECNPYHSGHGKLIAEARRRGADALVAVMSGDFVQRGEPALLSKFDRAADLARQGFSLVFELPVRYSLSSSERFAAASVGLLDSLGAVDTLFFGSECGDAGLLYDAAGAADSERTRNTVSSLCSQGYSYPAALTEAVKANFGERTSSVFLSPNNILAVDYVRALTRSGSRMRAETVLREMDGLTAHGVREAAEAGEIMYNLLTDETAGLLSEGDTSDPAKWDVICMASLRKISAEDLAEVPDMQSGLDRRIYKAAREETSLKKLLASAKTRSLTMSRVKRAVCNAVLGIKGTAPEIPPYARLLAVGQGGTEILRSISERARIPVSENLLTLSATSSEAAYRAGEEMLATDIYNTARRKPRPAGEDLTRRLFKKD